MKALRGGVADLIVWHSIIQCLHLRQRSKTVLLRQVFNSELLFSSLVEHMIQKNQCLFTNTQCKVCCALLISESQKLAHYQVGPCTSVLSRPNAKPSLFSAQ